MKKRRGRHRRRPLRLYSRAGLVLLLTLIYIGVFVTPVFIHQMKEADVAADTLLGHGLLDALATFVQTFCLLFGLTALRALWLLAWPLLCVLTAINIYTFNTFRTQVSKYAIAVFFEPKAREAQSLVTSDLAVTLAGGVFLAILGVLLLRRERKEARDGRNALVALLLAVGLITVNFGSMSTPYPPFNFLTSGYQYAYERFLMTPEQRQDISEEGASWAQAEEKPLVIVVVLGESARGDHFSINGYTRETTPFLEKRANLVNFKDTRSCDVWTRVAVPCIMTRATEKNKSPMYKETTFISVFRKLGFHTAWLSTQGKLSVYYPVTPITFEAQERVMLEEEQVLDNTIKDEQLVPLVEEQLQKQKKPLLIVLHAYGSHWQYSARYTKPFERYTPVCATTLSRKYSAADQMEEIGDCMSSREALVNSYDNSILYTDYVLDQIIQRLEGRNALFLYTADHGESLGENGKLLHGHEHEPSNRIVPMFWWASDAFIAANADRWEALKEKSAQPSSHDVIFHSVLGCAGVSSPLIDPSLNLCHDLRSR